MYLYKPPSEDWTTSVLPQADNPVVYIGDFNSHSIEWGNSSNGGNGKNLSNWAELINLHLLYDVKQIRRNYGNKTEKIHVSE